MNRFHYCIRLVIYLVFFVVGFGGLGVWIPMVQMGMGSKTATTATVVSNLATLVISLALTSFADFLLANSSVAGKTKRIVLNALMLSAATLGVSALIIPRGDIALKVAVSGAIVSIIEWLLVNAKNPSFQEETNALASLGGSV